MQSPFINSLIVWELAFFIAMNVLWIHIFLVFRSRKKHRKWEVKPLVSIIVPVFNKAEFLRKTLDSLLRLGYKNREIIVVNDGSTDGSEEICKEYKKKGLVRLITLDRNQGKAKALNVGIRHAKGELILTVDADSYLTEDSLSRMVSYFRDQKIGAVAGIVKVKREKGILNRLQIIEYFHQSFQRMVQGFFNAVLVLPGPISLYTKNAIEDAGYFESETLVEDWDMTMKIHKAGYKVVSEKRASAYTFAPRNVGEWWNQRKRWSRGGIKIAKKHKNILFKSRNKAMTRFIFPLHIMWLFVPLIVVPTFIIAIIPSNIAISGFFADLAILFAGFQAFLATGAGGIVHAYQGLDKVISNFILDMDMVKSFGYLSILAFTWFTYVSIKSFEKEFGPKTFISLIFMPIYWLMLNTVYLYSIIMEVFRSKVSRW